MEDVLLHFRMFIDNRMFSFSKIKTKQNKTHFSRRKEERCFMVQKTLTQVFDPFFHNSPLLFIVEKFSVELKMTHRKKWPFSNAWNSSFSASEYYEIPTRKIPWDRETRSKVNSKSEKSDFQGAKSSHPDLENESVKSQKVRNSSNPGRKRVLFKVGIFLIQVGKD